MSGLPVSLAASLGLTLLLETGLFLLTGKRDRRDLLLVMLVNVLTNPVVVLLYWLAALYTGWNRAAVTAVLELCAVAVEARYYKIYARAIPHPLRFAVAANIVSFGAGLLLQRLL